MNNKKGNYLLLSYIIGLIFITTGCNFLKNVNALARENLTRKDFVDHVPFEMVKDIIVIKAKINGDPIERSFIFDTGAFQSKVEASLADQLSLPTVATKSNSTAQGITQRVEISRINSLQLGETTFENISAGKLTYDETSASPCIAPHGIIGANVTKLAHWKIDYENQLLYFSDKPFEVDDNLETHKLPFSRPLLSGTPCINIEVNGEKIKDVLFDVGFNGGLVLPISYASRFPDSPSKTILDQSTSGIFGTNTDSLLVKNLTVNLGGYKSSIPVEFSSLNKILLGNEFIKHFQVNIDYKSKDIYLLPKQKVVIQPRREFIPGVLSETLWVVNTTTPELPLALGDTMNSINGLQPRDLFNNHCDYVLNINELLNQPSLKVEKVNGESVIISQ